MASIDWQKMTPNRGGAQSLSATGSTRQRNRSVNTSSCGAKCLGASSALGSLTGCQIKSQPTSGISGTSIETTTTLNTDSKLKI